jgi:hypothetical protein
MLVPFLIAVSAAPSATFDDSMKAMLDCVAIEAAEIEPTGDPPDKIALLSVARCENVVRNFRIARFHMLSAAGQTPAADAVVQMRDRAAVLEKAGRLLAARTVLQIRASQR